METNEEILRNLKSVQDKAIQEHMKAELTAERAKEETQKALSELQELYGVQTVKEARDKLSELNTELSSMLLEAKETLEKIS